MSFIVTEEIARRFPNERDTPPHASVSRMLLEYQVLDSILRNGYAIPHIIDFQEHRLPKRTQ